MPSGAGQRFNVTLEIVRGDNLKTEKKKKIKIKRTFPGSSSKAIYFSCNNK